MGPGVSIVRLPPIHSVQFITLYFHLIQCPCMPCNRICSLYRISSIVQYSYQEAIHILTDGHFTAIAVESLREKYTINENAAFVISVFIYICNISPFPRPKTKAYRSTIASCTKATNEC